MTRIAACLFVVLAAACPALSQTSSKAVVAVSAAAPESSVAAGTPFDVAITLAIRSGYHINAQKPSEDYLIGTKVDVQAPAGVTVMKTAYPAAKYAKFSFSDAPLAVYQGTVKITLTLKIAAGAAPGPLTIPAKVTFQACNDEQCLPPSTVDVSATAQVTGGADDAQAPQTITVTGAPPSARVLVDGRQAGLTNAQGKFVARNVPPGRHRVRVELDGYVPSEQMVDIADGPVSVAATLQPADAFQPPQTPANDNTAAQPPPAAKPPAQVESADDTAKGSTPIPSLIYVGGGAVAGILAVLAIYAVMKRR